MEIIYKRKTNFYETDAQGIIHHSNYPKYFEEFRGVFLDILGLPYHIFRENEKLDIVLLTLEIEYKYPIFFGEEMEIKGKFTLENKYFFHFEYKIYVDKQLRTVGKTKHCCIRRDNGKIVSIPKILIDKIIENGE